MIWKVVESKENSILNLTFNVASCNRISCHIVSIFFLNGTAFKKLSSKL